MIAPLHLELPSDLEPSTVTLGHRRRPRFALETQPGRCPLCNRVMHACIGRAGPAFHCGCPEVPASSQRPER